MSSPLTPLFQLTRDDGELAGWAQVLEQECQQALVDPDPVRPVSVCAGRPPKGWRAYVEAGGVLVVAAATMLPWHDADAAPVSITRLYPADGRAPIAAPCLARRAPDGVGGTTVLRAHEDRVPKDAGDVGRTPLVTTYDVGAGRVVAVWAPLGELLRAAGDRLRRFSDRTPVTERCATVDKGPLAGLMREVLVDAVTWRGLPFVSPSAFPSGAAAALVVRCDVDGIYGDHATQISKAFVRHGIPVSFFVNAAFAERHPGALDLDDLHQLGQHGYRHDVFDTEAENDENLAAGERWLQERTGKPPEGFVAPRGLWNPSLGRALRRRGYDYSADFGLSFDALPFVTPEGILQLPVHPYSPERAARWADEQGLPPPGDEDEVAHYLATVEDARTEGRPAHIYGHPERLARLADTLADRLASWLDTHRGVALTLEQYARWWRRRGQTGIVVEHAPERSPEGRPAFVVEAGDDVDLIVRSRTPLTVRHQGHTVTVEVADTPVSLRTRAAATVNAVSKARISGSGARDQ